MHGPACIFWANLTPFSLLLQWSSAAPCVCNRTGSCCDAGDSGNNHYHVDNLCVSSFEFFIQS
jgi:hypothetical protein